MRSGYGQSDPGRYITGLNQAAHGEFDGTHQDPATRCRKETGCVFVGLTGPVTPNPRSSHVGLTQFIDDAGAGDQSVRVRSY